MITHIALYAHSLNSHVNDTLRDASGDSTLVLLTNVHYTDDAAMRDLLARKHAEYQPGTQLLSTPHGLVDTLLNVSAKTVIVDSLNFLVSNLLLLHSAETDAAAAIVKRALIQELRRLYALRDTLSIERLIFITSDVDHDLFVRSRIGRQYRAVLHAANEFIVSALADEYALLLNGTRLQAELARHADEVFITHPRGHEQTVSAIHAILCPPPPDALYLGPSTPADVLDLPRR